MSRLDSGCNWRSVPSQIDRGSTGGMARRVAPNSVILWRAPVRTPPGPSSTYDPVTSKTLKGTARRGILCGRWQRGCPCLRSGVDHVIGHVVSSGVPQVLFVALISDGEGTGAHEWPPIRSHVGTDHSAASADDTGTPWRNLIPQLGLRALIASALIL
jgi:hypothetical protein